MAYSSPAHPRPSTPSDDGPATPVLRISSETPNAAATLNAKHTSLPTSTRWLIKLNGRGVFLLVLLATLIFGTVGLVSSGATIFPALASWGMLIATWLGASVVRRPDRMVALWCGPFVMAIAVTLLGQITLLGATPTLVREFTMFWAAMSSSAPLQVLAVAGTWLITRWRFRAPLTSDLS